MKMNKKTPKNIILAVFIAAVAFAGMTSCSSKSNDGNKDTADEQTLSDDNKDSIKQISFDPASLAELNLMGIEEARKRLETSGWEKSGQKEVYSKDKNSFALLSEKHPEHPYDVAYLTFSDTLHQQMEEALTAMGYTVTDGLEAEDWLIYKWTSNDTINAPSYSVYISHMNWITLEKMEEGLSFQWSVILPHKE